LPNRGDHDVTLSSRFDPQYLKALARNVGCIRRSSSAKLQHSEKQSGRGGYAVCQRPSNFKRVRLSRREEKVEKERVEREREREKEREGRREGERSRPRECISTNKRRIEPLLSSIYILPSGIHLFLIAPLIRASRRSVTELEKCGCYAPRNGDFPLRRTPAFVAIVDNSPASRCFESSFSRESRGKTGCKGSSLKINDCSAVNLFNYPFIPH